MEMAPAMHAPQVAKHALAALHAFDDKAAAEVVARGLSHRQRAVAAFLSS
jgi:hypothetical protein